MMPLHCIRVVLRLASEQWGVKVACLWGAGKEKGTTIAVLVCVFVETHQPSFAI
jgi:hypothetical protein